MVHNKYNTAKTVMIRWILLMRISPLALDDAVVAGVALPVSFAFSRKNRE